MENLVGGSIQVGTRRAAKAQSDSTQRTALEGGGIVHTVHVLSEWVTEIGGWIRLKRLGGLVGQEAIANAVDL